MKEIRKYTYLYCSWHSTWQLAVTLAEAMNRKTSRMEDDEMEDNSPEVQRKNSTLAK